PQRLGPIRSFRCTPPVVDDALGAGRAVPDAKLSDREGSRAVLQRALALPPDPEAAGRSFPKVSNFAARAPFEQLGAEFGKAVTRPAQTAKRFTLWFSLLRQLSTPAVEGCGPSSRARSRPALLERLS